MIKTLLFVLCLVTNGRHLVYGIRNTHTEDLELDKQLKLVNKPPVKSIHTEFGYIVDCIDIKKQPAFDHPLLKNHTLQRKPSVQNSMRAKSIVGLHKVECPSGTVPIRRTMKNDLIKSKLLFNNHIMTQELQPGHHYAEVYLVAEGGPYYGVGGQNSLYNPKIDSEDQITSSYVWVQNGPLHKADKIMFGWHVAPQLYGGDDTTYVFASWTNILKRTGCYNILCSGFVQTHPGYYLGAAVEKTSMYGGLMVQLSFSIFQDKNTKNWWLSVQNQHIGYFPAKLFSGMSSANIVGWCGETITPKGVPSPPMGSGYFPDGNLIHACYFRHVTFQNASWQNYGPEDYRQDIFNDKPDCYKAQFYGYVGKESEYALLFGGPGGDCEN